MKSRRDRAYDDGEDADQEEEEAVAESQSLIRDIAEQMKDMGEEETKAAIVPFVPGDLVLVRRCVCGH